MRLEVHAAQKVHAKAPAAGRTDKAPALPQKGGSPDKELFATFPEKSLRRRLWEAISSKKCVRCNGDHLRSACPKERQAWEDDFERPDFWTKKFSPPKQARVQLEPYVNRPCLQVLHIVCSAGLCLIDTCSDVSMARRDVLTAIGMSETAVVIAHLGGETSLQEIGTFTLEAELAVLCNVFAVNTEELPAGVIICPHWSVRRPASRTFPRQDCRPSRMLIGGGESVECYRTLARWISLVWRQSCSFLLPAPCTSHPPRTPIG